MIIDIAAISMPLLYRYAFDADAVSQVRRTE